MGKKLIELEDGMLVEVEVSGEEIEEIAGGLVDRVQTTFAAVHPILVNSCRPIIKAWQELNQEMKVEEAEVEIGLSFSGEGNLYITKSTASANLKVKLLLKPNPSNPSSSPEAITIPGFTSTCTFSSPPTCLTTWAQVKI